MSALSINLGVILLVLLVALINWIACMDDKKKKK